MAGVLMRLMKRGALFVAERLVSFLDENRLAIFAKQQEIKKCKELQLAWKVVCCLPPPYQGERAGKMSVETTILDMATSQSPSEELHDDGADYEVDTDGITLLSSSHSKPTDPRGFVFRICFLGP